MNKKTEKGFTIVEVIMAAFVLSVGFIGFVNLISKSIWNSTIDRDRIIAAGLAQEGIELVINVRDNNYQSEESGDSALDGIQSGYVDYKNGYSGGKDLYLDANGFYSSSAAGDKTKFKRSITVSGDDEEKTVTSQVWWDNSSSVPNPCVIDISSNDKKYCVQVQTELTNWK